MSESIEHLRRLIAFPTVSRDGNLDLIDYLKHELASCGAASELVFNEDGSKANLLATIGPANRPGILLSGHTDVVPVEGQAWSSDPFRLRSDRGRLYGRGSADMKGFIACCLAMAKRAAGRKLATPLQFAFSYDEEVGCLGVRRLIEMMRDLPVRPRFSIVGEPTSMQVVTAHKGKAGLRVTATGQEAHSSLAPTVVNAAYLAIDLVNEIRAIQSEIEAAGVRDGDYDVPYTTLHVSKLHGGDTLNIVPNLATFEMEIRHLPADDPEPILARIRVKADALAEAARRLSPAAGFSFEPGTAYPALDTAPDSEVVAFVRSLTGGNSLGKISFGTEGGLYQQRLGVPTVVCGPGSIVVAHKPDEYVEESQMAACDAFLDRLLERVAA